ncbi:hypothetical protein [Bacillus manliponensis]|uniref:hypothetical protein n=1 Tax=Bacillus manliponensis TaxID=574376 RepID=UPI00351791C7
MKRTLITFLFICLFTISGCTSEHINSSTNHTTVKPYHLTKDDQALLQLLPIRQGNIQLYDINIANKKDEIEIWLEYYHNGQKVKTMDAFSTSNFVNNKIQLSFGQQILQNEDGTPKTTQWFIHTTDASVNFIDDSIPQWSSSGFTSIEEEKKIRYNEKTALGAWICSTAEDGIISFIPPTDDAAIKNLISQNEHVYLFVVQVKNGDVSK